LVGSKNRSQNITGGGENKFYMHKKRKARTVLLEEGGGGDKEIKPVASKVKVTGPLERGERKEKMCQTAGNGKGKRSVPEHTKKRK